MCKSLQKGAFFSQLWVTLNVFDVNTIENNTLYVVFCVIMYANLSVFNGYTTDIPHRLLCVWTMRFISSNGMELLLRVAPYKKTTLKI